MTSTAPIPVLLFLLGCLFRESGAVCPGCLEFNVHLDWCQYSGQPITSSDTGHQESNTSPHWQVASGALSSMASSAQPGLVTGNPSETQANVTTCRHCQRTFKNKHGLSIHIGRMQSDNNKTIDTILYSKDFTPLPTQQVINEVATVATTILPTPTSTLAPSLSPLQPVHSTAVTPKSTCARRVRGQKMKPIRASPLPKETIVCVCGFRAVAFVGLK